ncbi:glyoxylate/hydroxypyruvate reductase A-like, partial [Mercenaria mercenaria]|uniref:glyoxylate/hydroxypyruvate reductase A-like n=1 Tax=Mercenaria mercenaria TaxID=6596 RepID=UPI00234EB26E
HCLVAIIHSYLHKSLKHTLKCHVIFKSIPGVETLIKEIGKEKPPSFTITRMGGAFSRFMAEYVLGYVLTKERSIIEVAKDQETRMWNKKKYSHYRSLTDLTIGILGVGEIGQEVARLCNASGMKVIGVTRSQPSEEKRCPAVSQYRTTSELAEVLHDSDYVCNILPSTPETRGLLSGDMFSHCRPKKSVFINMGRGDVIDEQSLVKAIREGWICGAVLDVFQTEPLPEESPLWNLPGVIITPHIAGVCLTNQVAENFVENYKLYCENKPLKFQVDFQRGY